MEETAQWRLQDFVATSSSENDPDIHDTESPM